MNSVESARRNLVFEVLKKPRVIVSCQNTEFPTDAERDNWLLAIMNLEREVTSIRHLIISEGGHPTKAEVERVQAVNRSNPPVSIVSPSRGFRFLTAALTFLNPTIRCYGPGERESAYAHLGIASSDRESVDLAIDRLTQRLAE